MQTTQLPRFASLRVTQIANANATISGGLGDIVVLHSSDGCPSPHALRPGRAVILSRGALVAFAHDIVAVGGLDENRSDPAEAIDDLAMRLARDGVQVRGIDSVRVSVSASIRLGIQPPPRSLPGPKRTLVDAEHAEIRRYLSCGSIGRFLEIGANEPVILSQSHHLERIGWTGALVEPIPQLADRLRRDRPTATVIQAVCSAPGPQRKLSLRLTDDLGHATLMRDFVDRSEILRETIEVDVTTADQVIQEHMDGSVDFISIDVEGHEADVLAGLDLVRWRPRLVLIEDDMRSLRPSRMLWAKGYRMLRRTQNNNWWIPSNAVDRMTWFERWRMLGKFLRMPFRARQSA